MFERVAIVLSRDCLRCDVVLVPRVLLGNGQENATPVLVAEYFEQFIQCAARLFFFCSTFTDSSRCETPHLVMRSAQPMREEKWITVDGYSRFK
ncbi:hypothetical protein BVU17_15800 [Haloarcula taiwanensis]|uniref:Uncharacterized protein n=1 Tax=Haloarcula taiwanensis TaxID=1932004 RepID=A0A2H5A2V9_9EURY|nr:hypothetical protein BVU17_15800 [Haloarcula taiwanensis]